MDYMLNEPPDICPRRSLNPYVAHMKVTGSAPQIIVTYPRVAGEPSAAQRILTDVRGGSIRPLEPPAAYADVPRL
ncbi:hypothetical protein [Actinomadura opuntiae]|uniref:hypothetical protein n=1 Tax=Actinomadura sp. OS1-43 TaxID=604315 RepID=UPI00255B1EF9|nr:hypothetical protein [Actinomadura sp. OS1-43]MDL4821067.1 hypothetical protein [Actinomadura sp. OS1-43]